jgi:Ser/Thr protein kinase RdoA (MazF antagonist)
LRLRIEQTSLRKVAREVGMSLGGFHGFLAGTDAHPATLRKVRAWYVREMARRREEEGFPVDSATAEAALAVLLEDIPVDLRAQAEKAMRSALTDWCGRHGTRAPGWASGDG